MGAPGAGQTKPKVMTSTNKKATTSKGHRYERSKDATTAGLTTSTSSKKLLGTRSPIESYTEWPTKCQKD